MGFVGCVSVSLLRLRVVADADPGALARVIEGFQQLNCVPRRVIAELNADNMIHIEVDVHGIRESQLELIAKRRPGDEHRSC